MAHHLPLQCVMKVETSSVDVVRVKGACDREREKEQVRERIVICKDAVTSTTGGERVRDFEGEGANIRKRETSEAFVGGCSSLRQCSRRKYRGGGKKGRIGTILCDIRTAFMITCV